MNADRTPVFHNYCSTVQGNTIAACGSLQMAAAGVVRLPDYAQEIDNNGNLTKTGIAIAGGLRRTLGRIMNPLKVLL